MPPEPCRELLAFQEATERQVVALDRSQEAAGPAEVPDDLEQHRQVPRVEQPPALGDQRRQ